MNFILSLAHFCEVHGPTSIICTQLLAPRCESCYGTSDSDSSGSPSPNAPSTPALSQSPPGPSRDDKHSEKGLPRIISHSANQSPTLQPSNIGSMETPPLSPVSPSGTSLPSSMASALQAVHTSSTTDTCRNCALTLPKPITDRLPSKSKPTLRSKELLAVNLPSLDGPTSIPHHMHTLSYLSTHTPSQPSCASLLRRAALRALSCENSPNPSQPSAIFFGNPKEGYSITYSFRILDPKARGGKRMYALLALCSHEHRLLESWCFIVAAFQALVKRISQFAAASSAAKTKLQRADSAGAVGMGKSGGIEGFLRREKEPTESRSLSDVLEREEIFVEVHAAFVGVLSGLGKRFGFEECWNEESVPASAVARAEWERERERERLERPGSAGSLMREKEMGMGVPVGVAQRV